MDELNRLQMEKEEAKEQATLAHKEWQAVVTLSGLKSPAAQRAKRHSEECLLRLEKVRQEYAAAIQKREVN